MPAGSPTVNHEFARNRLHHRSDLRLDKVRNSGNQFVGLNWLRNKHTKASRQCTRPILNSDMRRQGYGRSLPTGFGLEFSYATNKRKPIFVGHSKIKNQDIRFIPFEQLERLRS